MDIITDPPADETPVVSLDVNGLGQFVLLVHDRTLGGHVRAVLPVATQEALVSQAAELIANDAERQTSMEVQVTRHRWANMGDHAVLATEAVQYDPTETVEGLVLRVLDMRGAYRRHDSMDHIILRVVEGTEPELKVSDVPPF